MATAISGSDGSICAPLARSAVASGDVGLDIDIACKLATAAVRGDATMIDDSMAMAMAGGLDVERLLVGPVTAAARRLGDFWVEDTCDFVAVTMAMWQLRCGVERMLDARPVPVATSGRRVCFAAAPGDQHGFGAFLIGEIFARAGWAVLPTDADELIALVAEEWVDLVGLTITADRHRGAIAPAIAALRRASRNPRLAIMIGGRVVAADREFCRTVGADGMASDALSALTLADTLVAPLGSPC